MKRTRVRTCAAVLALALAPLPAPVAALQQEVPVVEQDIEVAIDRLGNADISATFTLPAAQWQLWNQLYGQNEFLLKRDFEHQFSAVVLKDFRLERDEMNRRATLSMKGAANAEYRGGGTWEVELERGARGTRVSDTVWQFSKSTAEGGAILQQNFRVKLPDGARNSEQVTGEMGIPVLRYELAAGHRSPLLPIVGAVLGVLGLVLVVLGLVRRPAPA